MTSRARRRSDRALMGGAGHTRAMVAVTAIMLFLTVLAAALGLALRRANDTLASDLAGRLTVQVLAADPATRDRETRAVIAALSSDRRIARVAPVDRAELAQLVRPWLGEDGTDPDLPIPTLVDVDLVRAADAPAIAVRARVAAPSARIDRHESWMRPVTDLMATLTWLAVAVVAMMAIATAATVILAARSGLAAHRDTIQVLHMLGSTDVQVARLFQRRIAMDVLSGGIAGAVLGAVAAATIGWRVARLDSGLTAGAPLAPTDWATLALMPAGFALLAMAAARATVLSSLRRVL